jgi:hypothetical protein
MPDAGRMQNETYLIINTFHYHNKSLGFYLMVGSGLLAMLSVANTACIGSQTNNTAERFGRRYQNCNRGATRHLSTAIEEK